MMMTGLSPSMAMARSFRSALDEREQVGVDDVGLRRGHAVRVVLECLERRVFEELVREWPGGGRPR